ncbi:hypothetical protein BDA96_02G112700 [Sorghum bicolor]|uniref:Uncharacterized protein n=2 Tax=Sorghum bicolor TaxID=4558 RepID=A0A921RLT7_SORBI|nr:hypothetical protein BDA96_02G112700 [Sorghum bicolor]OQU88861.1 hypothetical protein SORBI_3002G107466 [Sorghum bicolor]
MTPISPTDVLRLDRSVILNWRCRARRRCPLILSTLLAACMGRIPTWASRSLSTRRPASHSWLLINYHAYWQSGSALRHWL